jgi:hypothetical protein
MAKKSKKGGAEVCSMADWEVEEDLRALARAKAVKADPERMKKVKALAKSKLDDYKRREDEAKTMVDLGEGKDI